MKKNKAFFLDRDGTINVDYGYIQDTDRLVLLEGAAKAVRMMNESGYKVIVITNQSGVARGYFDDSDVVKVNDALQKMLQAHGAHIDRFYVCPHHPNGIIAPYNIACRCRKPGLLLYEQAVRDYLIDMGQSYAAGDKISDIQNLYQMGIKQTGLISERVQAGCYRSLLEFTKHVLQ